MDLVNCLWATTFEVAPAQDEPEAVHIIATLERIREAAQGNEPLMPLFIEAVKVQATLGEIMGVLREVFGEASRAPVLASSGF